MDSFSPKLPLIFHANDRISIIVPYKSLWYNYVVLFVFKQPLIVITQSNTTDIHLYLITFIQTFVFLIKWIQLLYNCPRNLAIACFHKT